MRRLLLILSAALLTLLPLRAQVDSADVAKTLSLVDEYVKALESERLETKLAECDFLIQTCTDSLLRQAVAVRLYGHYAESPLMGDESVAVHLYDRWFADGSVAFPSADAEFSARLFAEFNRSSLLWQPAPVLEMSGMEEEPVTVPAPSGRLSVLYFYDTDCSKCRLETILLRHYLEEQETDLDFYAVYVGSDRDSWLSYARESLQPDSPHVRVFHAWDPEAASDFPRLYGILQTPRLFLVDRGGVIIGRRLSVDALRQLLELGRVESELQERNPVGARLPSITVEGVLCKPGRAVARKRDLSRLRGNPAYLVFHSESCARCKEELPALQASLSCGSKAFLVDVDRILAEQPELARQLFDAFDLTVLPHILSVDRRGLILARYISFAGTE